MYRRFQKYRQKENKKEKGGKESMAMFEKRMRNRKIAGNEQERRKREGVMTIDKLQHRYRTRSRR